MRYNYQYFNETITEFQKLRSELSNLDQRAQYLCKHYENDEEKTILNGCMIECLDGIVRTAQIMKQNIQYNHEF